MEVVSGLERRERAGDMGSIYSLEVKNAGHAKAAQLFLTRHNLVVRDF
jgi:hypothetical protein